MSLRRKVIVTGLRTTQRRKPCISPANKADATSSLRLCAALAPSPTRSRFRSKTSMKFVDYQFRIEIGLDLSLEEVAHCIQVALHHYDWKCKAAGRKGGFLYSWGWNLWNGFSSTEYLTWAEIDILCKILEQEDHYGKGLHLWWPITEEFAHAREQSKKVNS